jgi:hypothetical protein
VYYSLSVGARLAFQLVLLLALLYLLIGLIRPAWAWASKRRWVVARPIAAMALAGGAFIGVIAYTHAQPDGPHAVKGYIEVVPPEQWEAWRIGQ